MRATVMSVESRMQPEKREFFRADNRPERPNGESYGFRGQPTPDPESTGSVAYCKQIDWSQTSEEEIVKMVCAPCEEHKPMDGDDIHHLNFQCGSCFHRMRNCTKMLTLEYLQFPVSGLLD